MYLRRYPPILPPDTSPPAPSPPASYRRISCRWKSGQKRQVGHLATFLPLFSKKKNAEICKNCNSCVWKLKTLEQSHSFCCTHADSAGRHRRTTKETTKSVCSAADPTEDPMSRCGFGSKASVCMRVLSRGVSQHTLRPDQSRSSRRWWAGINFKGHVGTYYELRRHIPLVFWFCFGFRNKHFWNRIIIRMNTVPFLIS